ncbi:MAG TPA: hypothetical protein VFR73_07650 [Hyphomicrobiaceae bacterium]|nr:hypothetical protein [Hyphomicrobiaceae bacterium]
MSARTFLQHPFRPVVSSIAAAALVFAQLPTAQAASAMTRAEYEACQARDEQGFRLAVETLTRRSLEAGIAGFDYRAVVNDEWRRGNVDDVIDRQVDQTIGELRDESSWVQLWQTLTSQQKARELATTAAERVYRSDAMKKALEGVATGIGKEIGKRIELATVDTAGPATQCVQAFLGPRYGATIARIVATGTGREYGIDPVKGAAQVSTGQVVVEGTDALAGTVVLVVRRQLANMASRIGQRVVGSILGRLVSVVAGGVGLVLIAKDIWDFRHGVLPIIGTEMKSKETKDKVRDELAKSVSEQIGESIKEIGSKTADRVVEIWLEFRRAHAKVVELAERVEVFKRFLDTVKPDDLPKLDEVVALVLASEGEAGIIRRLDNGTLHRAVSGLPTGAIDIARETQSLETALQWSAVAGDSLAKVVEFEIYRQAKPDSFTKASLQKLLGLQDRVAVIRLAALQPAARDALFALPANELKGLARSLDEPQLDSLSRYLTGLDKSSALRVLQVVGQNPTRMAELGKPSVRDAILSSSDQAAALGMMLQATSVPDPTVLLAHAQLVLDGRVSPLLLWEKHAVWLAAAVVLSLALLMMLKRLVFGTRPKIIVQESYGRSRGDRG